SIAVFCGSSCGNNPAYETAARELGKTLAQRGITLVYGGASVGLMGSVADGVLEVGGKVVGVMPGALRDKEIAHEGITELYWTGTMHERKALMYEMSDGIISLPGGFGTFDETFEFLTWGQLGLHGKPTGLLNINGYFDRLLEQLDTMVSEGFLKQVNRGMLLVQNDPETLLDAMKKYVPPKEGKWIKKGEM
ncbi:MAG: TIGR00730 family Rossman fold protein, partial [Spirochaetales bacterium]|nr:TIGR00730 family Rossman fold protein [Spirochaetales bacterium]